MILVPSYSANRAVGLDSSSAEESGRLRPAARADRVPFMVAGPPARVK
jgi:hypothetical protein